MYGSFLSLFYISIGIFVAVDHVSELNLEWLIDWWIVTSANNVLTENDICDWNFYIVCMRVQSTRLRVG